MDTIFAPENVCFLLQLAIGVGTLFGAWLVGWLLDRRRDRSLDEREARYAHILQCQLRQVPPEMAADDACLVIGSTVMGCDAFKLYVAKLINLVGGNVDLLEAVLRRARREATCRMLAAADDAGATAVWNIRLETAMLSTRRGASVEVVCYGTALRLLPPNTGGGRE